MKHRPFHSKEFHHTEIVTSHIECCKKHEISNLSKKSNKRIPRQRTCTINSCGVMPYFLASSIFWKQRILWHFLALISWHLLPVILHQINEHLKHLQSISHILLHYKLMCFNQVLGYISSFLVALQFKIFFVI